MEMFMQVLILYEKKKIFKETLLFMNVIIFCLQAG